MTKLKELKDARDAAKIAEWALDAMKADIIKHGVEDYG